MATTVAPVRPGSPELTALLADIAEGAADRERDLTPPTEALAKVRAAGLTSLRVPTSAGGAGASVRELFATLIALAEADSNVAHILRAHFWVVEQQLIFPDPQRRASSLELIAGGAIFGNAFSEQGDKAVGLDFDTTVTPDPAGSGYRLNGKKYYSTGSIYATHTEVWASAPGGRVGIAIVPVDREGVSILDDWDGFGQRLTGTGTTILDDVRVEAEEYFDLGDPATPAPSYEAPFLQLFLQAVTTGILRSVRTDALALVHGRARNFSHASTPVPTLDPQVLQVIGEIDADAFAAEAIVLAAADVIAEAVDSVRDGVPDAVLTVAAQQAAARAKVAVDRFAAATATHLLDVGGASATQSFRNLDRHWRNIRTISTHNPTFLKASALGAHLVNGTAFPANAYF